MNDLIDCLRECLAELQDERELAPHHQTLDAGEAPRPPCVGLVPISVFELGEREAQIRWGTHAANDAPPAHPDKVLVVTREAGIVRCQAIPFSESQEGQEKERARRARQRPPRPVRQKSLRLKNSKNWQGGLVGVPAAAAAVPL